MKKPYNACNLPWIGCLVSADGAVRPCCWLKWGVGNLNEGSFEEIWNGPEMQELRAAVISGRVNPQFCANAGCPYDTQQVVVIIDPGHTNDVFDAARGPGCPIRIQAANLRHVRRFKVRSWLPIDGDHQADLIEGWYV